VGISAFGGVCAMIYLLLDALKPTQKTSKGSCLH
jgi:hypothetical protein